MDQKTRRALGERLLDWYRENRRPLPWRETDDPYAILVSEIMLQQTRVDTVIPYYLRFMQAFPTLADLADAALDDVLQLWQGLGYYRRARNLHALARIVRDRFNGRLPDNPEALAALPGIGAYTAGAIAGIAFGRRVPAVDGNVKRVLARWLNIVEDVNRQPQKRALFALAKQFAEETTDPASWTQALMELGALVCLPQQPHCARCPVAAYCRACQHGDPAAIPFKPPRRSLPTRPLTAAMLVVAGHVLLRQRPDDGLLAGLWELPGVEGHGDRARRTLQDLLSASLAGTNVQPERKLTRRVWTFSHLRWDVEIWRFTLGPQASRRFDVMRAPANPFVWAAWPVNDLPLTTLTRRVLADMIEAEWK